LQLAIVSTLILFHFFFIL